jgi:hypothetical protein
MVEALERGHLRQRKPHLYYSPQHDPIQCSIFGFGRHDWLKCLDPCRSLGRVTRAVCCGVSSSIACKYVKSFFLTNSLKLKGFEFSKKKPPYHAAGRRWVLMHTVGIFRVDI